jgi:RNA polymerase sigma factor (sigma-70 family)
MRAKESLMEAAVGRERSPAQHEKALVKKAKQYLQQRLQKLAPDAVLTQAWDRFYQTYTEVLRRMAAEFHLDGHQSEDLVQEVWARVIVHLQDFHGDEHGAGLRGWLYTLIRNQALNFIRRKVRHPVRLASGTEMHGVADRGPGPAAHWQACWDRELMHLLLAELAKKTTPTNHRLLILRWIEGRSLAEVALTLNLSEKQVTYRQQRLFRKLRAALAVYRGEPFGAASESFPFPR